MSSLMRLYKDIDSTRLRLTGSPRGVVLSLSLYLSPPGPPVLPHASRHPSCASFRGTRPARVLPNVCFTLCVRFAIYTTTTTMTKSFVCRRHRPMETRRLRAAMVSKSFKVERWGNRRIDRLHRRRRRRRRPRSPFPLITSSRACTRARARRRGAARVSSCRAGVLDRKKHFAGVRALPRELTKRILLTAV